MQNVEKIARELSKGYAPQSDGAKPRIKKVYDQTFLSLVKRKDLRPFFKLYEYEDPIMKAWAFQGIYRILEGKKTLSEKNKDQFEQIVKDILSQTKKFSYYIGDIEDNVSLREHHANRICWLDSSLTFEPVLNYVQSHQDKWDKVIGELLLEILSQKSDPRVIDLLLTYMEDIDPSNIQDKKTIIQAFNNVGTIKDTKKLQSAEGLFKQDFKKLQHSLKTISNKGVKRNTILLMEDILTTGIKLNMDLKTETLDFLEKLDWTFPNLDQIAIDFKDNERFRTILLKKLEKTENKRLVKDILNAISLIQEDIPHSKEIIINTIQRHQFNETDLIINLMESDTLNESIILTLLEDGKPWEQEFIREVLNLYPDKINEWNKIRNAITEILNTFPEDLDKKEQKSHLIEQKKFALQVTIDQKNLDLLKKCLSNFLNLNDEELRKMALFAIMTSQNDDLLVDLRKEMDKDDSIKKYVTKFWKQLERRDWKFYY
ncbi:MAG: hypothetical protein GF317_19010 [Candidatus Lokiarchaeota archaeon]|nr:hypothetical protein [Candidatus Lokiarchaeota archaeon]MBD3201606.1 hypothetical protein [Candidatus Lokiarchaeota archaeon]